jgi:adenosylcobalamin-dependent ribonucleoside-triphosphate reductase
MDRRYFELIKPKYLTWEFLSKYVEVKPPFGAIGPIVYLRTYSRFVPQMSRRELWWETCMRVTEYSMSLFPAKPRYPMSFEELQAEAEELFDNLFWMKVFAAGRTMFTGGAQLKTGDSQFNCSFIAVSELKAFKDALYLLMNGCGVGFSVERQYTENLPRFRQDFKVRHLDYNPIARGKREDITRLEEDDNNHIIKIGDSKEGWCDALFGFLSNLADLSCWKNFVFIYNDVRPEGEKLKTFGGRASGPAPLRLMFERIEQTIKEAPKGHLRPVDVMDIMNIIAAAVVVGGVRRSSEIAFGNLDDVDFVEAKLNLWSDPDKQRYQATRVLSNNSVAIWEKPSKAQLVDIFERIKNNGEPGISIAGNAAKRRPNYKGSNPCHEILLDHNGVCNLTTINMAAFVEADRIFNWKAFERALYHAVRMGSRITNVNMWDPDWDYVQKRDRLLGVSLTGQMDCWNKMGVDFDSTTAINILSSAKAYARAYADEYHNIMGIPTSLLITTVKPEGTISQLPTVSSGVHASYAPYYIRRVRISSNDPVAKALRDMGLEPQPENGQGKDLDAPDCSTWVFSFPIKTDAKIRAIDEPAIRQLKRYKVMMDEYVDHTCSITVTVAPDEWDEVVDWVYDNWESCVGIAFLPRFDPSEPGNMYPQMPYETCTEEQYHEMVKAMGTIDEDELVALISVFEQEYEEHELDAGCATGMCPVR